jgi:MFS family permease
MRCGEKSLFTLKFVMFKGKYYIVVVSTLIGTCFQFYNFGILNGLKPQLEGWIHDVYFNRNSNHLTSFVFAVLWSALVSAIALGSIPATLLADYFAANFGPRRCLIFNGILGILVLLLELIAVCISIPEIIWFTRLITGFSMTLGFCLVSSYLADITPIKLRPRLDRISQVGF